MEEKSVEGPKVKRVVGKPLVKYMRELSVGIAGIAITFMEAIFRTTVAQLQSTLEVI